jgi:hypothetical protein
MVVEENIVRDKKCSGSQLGESRERYVDLTFSVFDRNILTLDVSGSLESLAEPVQVRRISCYPAVEESNHRERLLLCTRGERPRHCRTAEHSDELPPF